jgi:DNA mismatch repair protein MutS2
VPGRSNAFAVSERLGLPPSVIEAARENVSRENSRFEDVVSGLETARQELEREKELAESHRREAESGRRDAQRLRDVAENAAEKELDRARAQARAIVEQTRLKSNLLLNELEELKKNSEKDGFAGALSGAKAGQRAFLRELEAAADPVSGKKAEAYRLPRPLKRGDTVILAELGSRATVLNPPDSSGKVRVQAGILKTTVKLSELRLVDDSAKRVTLGGGAVTTREAVKAAKANASADVDLRGMDSLEATAELDRFLDRSVLAGIATVTIIHGKGTGALRSAIQTHLKKHRSVKTFRPGVFGEGEAGVTVAELK